MNTLLKMAARNMGRNRRRTGLTAVTVTIVVLALIFLQSFMGGMIMQVLDLSANFITGHVKVYPEGYMDKEVLMPLDLGIMDSSEAARAVAATEGVRTVSRRIKFFTLAQHGDHDEFPIMMGIEPELERGVIQLDHSIARGRYFGEAPREAVLGFGLARKLGIIAELTDDYEPGSAKLQIMAPRGIPMTFSVVGISRFGFSLLDDQTMFVRFEDAQFAADMDMDDMATEIMVLLEERRQVPTLLPVITAALGDRAAELEVVPWQRHDWLFGLVQTIYVMVGIMLFILFFVAGSTVVNTMLMAVMERTREIGMLQALGMKPREIVAMILAEALTIGVLGGVIGMALGITVSLIFQQTGIPVGESLANMEMPIGDTLRIEFFWWSAPAAFLFGVVMALIASLWPAVKAARLSPTQALRAL